MATTGPHIPRAFVGLASFGIALWLLSWLEPVIIPVVVAILLTFLLSPSVTLLQRRSVPRVAAVVLVVLITFGLIGGMGWLVGRQVAALVDTYPQYEQNLNAKLDILRSPEGGFVDRLQNTVEKISRQMERKKPTPADEAANPITVTVVQDSSPFQLSKIWSVLGPAMEPFAAVGLTIVLVLFMLLRREDLRDRVLSLVGRGHLTLTTKALDEAGERIGRYLVTQLSINAGYGVAVAAGLFLIGVPYALLWGFFAAVLRYIPYLGSWLAALLPIGLSLLVFSSWTAALLVVGLFLVLELVTNMVIEPTLFGRGVGVSETATLVMIAFWAWLWGPIGLIVATPLTVCLVVLGKYVPFLSFLDTLLGDEPVLEAPLGYYQRLLARDQDEASDIAAAHLGAGSLTDTFDGLLVPALIRAKRDVDRKMLDEEEHRFVVTAVRDAVDELVTRQTKAVKQEEAAEGLASVSAEPRIRILVLGCAARDTSDDTGLLMLKEALDPGWYDVTLIGSALMASETITAVTQHQPAVVCIATLPPGGLAQTRLLCLRLRRNFPDLRILVGRWGMTGDAAEVRAHLLAAGATEVATTLTESCAQFAALLPLVPARAALEPSTA